MRSPQGANFPLLKIPEQCLYIMAFFLIFSIEKRSENELLSRYGTNTCSLKWNPVHHWNSAHKICLIWFILWPFVMVRVCISSVCIVDSLSAVMCVCVRHWSQRLHGKHGETNVPFTKTRAWKKKSWLAQCVGEKGTLGANRNCTLPPPPAHREKESARGISTLSLQRIFVLFHLWSLGYF